MRSKKLLLNSKFDPAGDQPKAIKEIIKNINNNVKDQVLLGVTGSGKTFIISKVLEQLNRPAIILSHNKTLASQLYSEMKSFFPKNKVEYFISHFDFYRPEAYLPKTDTYLNKTSRANWTIDAMRSSTLNSLLTNNNTIVVASVASIYANVNPVIYRKAFIHVYKDQKLKIEEFIKDLVKNYYSQNNIESKNGIFQKKGKVITVFPYWTNKYKIRVIFNHDSVVSIAKLDFLSNKLLQEEEEAIIFPTNSYKNENLDINRVIEDIKKELKTRLNELESENKLLEKQRLSLRVNEDIQELKEFGYCSGIENYSMYLDDRKPGETPFTIFDFLPKNALIIIDESHKMIPQIKGMYFGDNARKSTLVKHGFRLPTSKENRPLKFDEFENLNFQKIFISATPAEYELNKAHNNVIEVINRPTGLIDPEIEIKKNEDNVIEDIHNQLLIQRENNHRTLILTLTMRQAEELSKYLIKNNFKAAYIHNQLTTFEREEVLRKLRLGVFEVVIGINLLREGLDLPEVSKILILNADLESFLRTKSCLIQIIGRASRNINGKVIMYANNISRSMQGAIEETNRRRSIQIEYNKKHNITPKTIIKPISNEFKEYKFAVDDKIIKNTKKLEKTIFKLKQEMNEASKNLDFEKSIKLRDLIIELEGKQK